MLRNSEVTAVCGRDVAGFSARGAIVEAVGAEPDVVLAFTDSAILHAGAALFRLITHHANDGSRHGSLQRKLYLTSLACGKVSVF
jgi:hypothetical protein